MAAKKKSKKVTPKRKQPKKECRICGNGLHCHFCGRGFDNRGYDRSFTFRAGGPLHYICPSCAE